MCSRNGQKCAVNCTKTAHQKAQKQQNCSPSRAPITQAILRHCESVTCQIIIPVQKEEELSLWYFFLVFDLLSQHKYPQTSPAAARGRHREVRGNSFVIIWADEE